MARASRNGTAAVAVGTRPECGLSLSAGFLTVAILDFKMGGWKRRADLAEEAAAKRAWHPVGYTTTQERKAGGLVA